MTHFDINFEIKDIEFITGLWTFDTKDDILKAIDILIYFGRIFIVSSRRNNKLISFKSFVNFLIELYEIQNEVEDIKESILFENIAFSRILETMRRS